MARLRRRQGTHRHRAGYSARLAAGSHLAVMPCRRRRRLPLWCCTPAMRSPITTACARRPITGCRAALTADAESMFAFDPKGCAGQPCSVSAGALSLQGDPDLLIVCAHDPSLLEQAQATGEAQARSSVLSRELSGGCCDDGVAHEARQTALLREGSSGEHGLDCSLGTTVLRGPALLCRRFREPPGCGGPQRLCRTAPPRAPPD